MLKQALLAGAIAVSAPALAQVQAGGQTGPGAEVPAATPQTMPAQDQAAQPGAMPATPDQMTEATDPAQPADQQPAATPDQVAEAVDQGFPAYDRNGDGTLDEAEFAAWMTELRTASDPSVTADSPEMAAWAGQAFASADTDQSATLTRDEVTAFLSQNAS